MKNILILTETGWYHKYDLKTNCGYYLKDEIEQLFQLSKYIEAGDFSWIDFEGLDKLEKLSPQEIAELYYISKQWEPLYSYCYDNINNQFIYLSDDDGHSSKVWYRNLNVFLKNFGSLICNKINYVYDLILEPFNENISTELSKLSPAGIYLNIEKLKICASNVIDIPIYCILKKDFIDEMHDVVKEGNIKPEYSLIYNGKWEIKERTV